MSSAESAVPAHDTYDAFYDALMVPIDDIEFPEEIAHLLPHRPEDESIPACAVLGSFKHHGLIKHTIAQLQTAGIHVITPRAEEIVKGDNGFPILEGDLAIRQAYDAKHAATQEPLNDRSFNALIEALFIKGVKMADFVYIVNLEGYVGDSVSGELGVALGQNIPLLAMEPLNPELDREQGFTWPQHYEWMAASIPAIDLDELVGIVQTGKVQDEGFRMSIE